MFGGVLGVFWGVFGGVLGDVWGGVWERFAGIFVAFCRDLGGKNGLKKLTKKRINKII